MKTLITGGAGFVGSHLVDKLIKEGQSVVIVDDLSTGKKENVNSEAKFYQLDIQSPEIENVFLAEKPEIVFHLAAQVDLRKSVESPIENAKINILGSLNVLENCRKFGVKKIIFASSGGVIYGEAEKIPTSESALEAPLSPYGVEKLAVEKYLKFYRKSFGLSSISLRFANIYGPRQNSKGESGVVAIFTDKILNGESPIIYGEGNQTRDYLYVEDAVSALSESGREQFSAASGIFNVGTGQETSVDEIYEIIAGKTNQEIEPKKEAEKKGDLQRSCLNCSLIKKELNWEPKFNLEEGLEKTINWFRTKIS